MTASNDTGRRLHAQTLYRTAAADGDGTFVQFAEVIHGFVMTDPANSGSIGTIGHRVHVTFTANHHFTGQLWGQNGA